jgi:hypothetical protein
MSDSRFVLRMLLPAPYLPARAGGQRRGDRAEVVTGRLRRSVMMGDYGRLDTWPP